LYSVADVGTLDCDIFWPSSRWAREVSRMPESFGDRLRQRREQNQIALTSIAEQTKIGLPLLEALERDDVSRWPAGIFRRAFIRAYAHAIGLDADIVVREFLELYPDPIEIVTVPSAAPPSIGAAWGSEGPPARIQYLAGSVVDCWSRIRRGIVEMRKPAVEMPAVANRTPVTAPSASEHDLLDAARLCTELGQADDVAPLLEQAVRILEAVGLIVWAWDPLAVQLKPALAHGYSDKVLAQLPRVGRDADNATAATFRSAQTSVVKSSELASGALVVPLLTRGGCVGVLAIELQHRREQKGSVRALATIFAAQLATLVGAAQPAETADRRLA